MVREPYRGGVSRSLRERTITGVFWSGAGQLGANLARYGTIVLLGFWLPATTFGDLAIASAVFAIAQVVGELGLVGAVIQTPEAEEPVLSTAFWLNIAASVAVGLIALLSAGGIAALLDYPSAAPILRVVSLAFPIAALTVVPRALLMRELRFRRLSTATWSGEVAFGSVAVGATLAGAGLWGVLAAMIVQRAVLSALLWFSTPWRPKALVDRDAVAALLRFGLPASLTGLFGQAANYIGYGAVGRFVGIAGVGYYHFAAQTSLLPLQRLAGIVARVAFPAMAQVQGQPQRMRRAFLDSSRYLLTVMLPAGVVMAGAGPWFLRAAYGDKWLESALPLRLLAVAGIFFALEIAKAYYRAVGKPERAMYLVALSIGSFLAALWLLASAGGVTPVSVAAAMAIAVALSGMVGWWFAARDAGLPPRALAELLRPVAQGGLVAAIPAALFELPVAAGVSPWVPVFVLPPSMGVLYLLATTPEHRQILFGLARALPGQHRND